MTTAELAGTPRGTIRPDRIWIWDVKAEERRRGMNPDPRERKCR